MDSTEIFSPNVAVPVVAVIFCAVVVFLFGFKAPVQPPSFDFDEDKKQSQKKSKRSKVCISLFSFDCIMREKLLGIVYIVI
jgi:hypothetical protein